MPRTKYLYLPLIELSEALAAKDFYVGTDAYFRMRRYAESMLGRVEPPTLERIRWELSALLCRTGEEQEKFGEIFEDFVQSFQSDQAVVPLPSLPTPELPIAKPPAIEQQQPVVDDRPSTLPAPPRKTTGRSGPLRIELTFPSDGPHDDLRVWNTAETDQAVRPLREKEWTTVEDWDIMASIQRTIRAGGIPLFEKRRRKKAPQYLFLIDQKSPRDHLANLYTDLAIELRRRDMDVEFLYYDFRPYRCWRDPRDPHTFTTIENIQSEFASYKLLLVGEADGLLDLPDLRPSNLALDLFDNWREVALLCPKSTADWGDAELSLCPLFPVVPANAIGLAALVQQWEGTDVFTPRYWQTVSPEPALPIGASDEAPEMLEKSIEKLYYYLGEHGFQWLCAAALYPEIYWSLTKLLHNEAIPPDMQFGQWEQNRLWQTALLRLSRVHWFRQGAIPTPVRTFLREYFESQLPPEKRQAIRDELLRVLGLKENQPPLNSYAAANQEFTIAWYEYERAIATPGLSEEERARIEAEFREKGLAKIQLAEIEDAIGRRIYQEVQERALWPPVPDLPGFHVLWVDDEPKNNERFQDSLNELFHAIFTNATSTEEALISLAERGFDLIISDISRYHRDDEGAKMMRIFQERRIPTPVIFYTTPAMVSRYSEELQSLGAAGVFASHEQVRNFMSARVQEKQRREGGTSFENISQSQSQQQSSAPPPDQRIAAAEAALIDGEIERISENYETATGYYRHALNLFTDLKDDMGRANAHNVLGKLYAATNDLENALQHFRSASTLYVSLNSNSAYASTLMEMGSVQWKMRRVMDAQRSYAEALEILENLGDEKNLIDVRKALSEISASQHMAQNRSVENYNVFESVEKLSNEKQGLILYYIPKKMQTNEMVRCMVRIATTVEVLRENWKADNADLQETVYITNRTSVKLEQVIDNEDNKLDFDITQMSDSQQWVTSSEYAQWIFNVRPEKEGSYQLKLKIILFKMNPGTELQRTIVLEREVVVTDRHKPYSQTQKKAPMRKRK